MHRRFAYFLVVLAVAACGATARAQTSQFVYVPEKAAVGTVLHFNKSNLDGSRPTRISWYLVDPERLESLKWNKGQTTATLVRARMDWQRFSVREFQSWHWERGKTPELRGTLNASADGKTLAVSFLDGKTVPVNRWPWHSYDFDFASLAITLPHMRDPHVDVIFWRTDVVFVGEGQDFAELGGVRMHFEAAETRNGREVRRYTIGGAGLQYLYGKLWTDVATGLLVEYEIPVGDEPGYKDVRLRLERMERMTPDQWLAFKKSAIGER